MLLEIVLFPLKEANYMTDYVLLLFSSAANCKIIRGERELLREG